MSDYEEVIDALIQQFINTQGKPVVVRQANKSDNISVDDDGNIESIEDGEAALQEVMDNFSDIMGPVAYAMGSRALEDLDLEGLNLPDDLEEKM
ncbi:MAG: hypothetical protein ABEJ99_02600 [Candidatus Nanohaloarchaea archaeon]